jgi:hypothetical protein
MVQRQFSRIELLSAGNQRKIVHIDEKFCNETAQQIQVRNQFLRHIPLITECNERKQTLTDSSNTGGGNIRPARGNFLV